MKWIFYIKNQYEKIKYNIDFIQIIVYTKDS